LSLKIRPAIRYKNGSNVAQQLAKKVFDTMNKESFLFSFRPPENRDVLSLLLILDRRDDSDTPLLTQWTY
jgi:vacuolar protein sorting-associated protein 45